MPWIDDEESLLAKINPAKGAPNPDDIAEATPAPTTISYCVFFWEQIINFCTNCSSKVPVGHTVQQTHQQILKV